MLSKHSLCVLNGNGFPKFEHCMEVGIIGTFKKIEYVQWTLFICS